MATRTITTKLALDGEAEYRAKLKNINAEISLHKSELAKVQAQYKSSANSMEALTAKQSALRTQLVTLNKRQAEQTSMLEKARAAYESYGKRAEELRAKHDMLKNSSAASAEEEKKLADALDEAEVNMKKAANSITNYETQLNRTQMEQINLGAELKRTKGYLDEARNSSDGCATSIDQYGKEVKKAAEETQELGGKGGNAVEALANALKASGLVEKAKEITAALYDCVDTFGAFQSQMSAVQAISGASAQDMAALAEKAKEMGAATSFTAAEAGQALEYMAMAGWKTGDMLDGLEGVMHLAAASGEDLASTSDIVTDALTAFGLKASDSGHFADVLAAASANANTNVGMMGETFKYAAPVAGALGYSIEDVALAVGLMAGSMIKGGEAGTALRGMLTNLAKPSSDVAGYMEKLGISLTDSQGKMRSLSDLLGLLRDRFSELSAAEKTEYAAGIAGKEAMSGLLAIVNASEEDYRKLTEAISSCNGAAERMSETRLDNYAGQITLLRSAVDGFKLAVGEALIPALGNLAEAGTEAFSWAAAFVEENPWLVQAIAGAAGAIGLLAAGMAAYTAVAAAAEAVTGRLKLTMSLCPIAAVAAAAGALVAVMANAAARTAEISEGTRNLTKSLKETKAAYEELAASMEEERSGVTDSVRALEKLLAAENKTAAQKDQLLRMVDELNEKIPGLGLVYDEAADAINMTGDALERMAEAAGEQEEYDAQVERLNELFTEREAITRELEDAQRKLDEAMADAQWDSFGGAMNDSAVAVGQLREGVAALTAAQTDNAAQIAAIEEAATAYNEQQADAAVQTDEFTAKMEVQAEELRELEAAYNESYAAAMESIQGQIGLFQEMDGSAKTSVDSLIETLKGQVAYLETYNQNILKAMEMGVDEGLVRKLSDGSEKSAQILAAIVQGGTEDIQALNEQLAKVEEGKESFSNSVAEMETRFKEKMEAVNRDMREMVQELNLKEAAYKAGWNNIQGLIDGTADQKRALIAKYTEMGKAAVAAYKKAVDQHSPSREFQKAGSYDIRGIIQGAEAEKARLDAAYRDMARTALESMRRGLPSTFVEPRVPGPADQTAAIVEAVRGALGAGTAGGQGLSAADVAAAVREALSGVSVNMNQRKVGELVTDWQRNNDRGRGV